MADVEKEHKGEKKGDKEERGNKESHWEGKGREMKEGRGEGKKGRDSPTHRPTDRVALKQNSNR